jgi:thiosulfate/3-mercaptopyruvate sulfurtransferase
MRKLSCLAVSALMTMMFAGCAATHGTSPKGLEVPIEKAAVKFSSDVKEGGYKIVTTDELKKWLDEGKKMTVLSSLPWSEDRVLGIIPGALSAPLPKNEKELAPEDKEFLLRAAGNDKDKVLVVYCGFVACRRSHIGAKLLIDNGYKNVYRYPAGITGWQESGYPLKKLFD